MPRLRGAVLAAVAALLLGAGVAACGEDPGPIDLTSVTVANGVTPENRGGFIREAIEQLGLEVEWGFETDARNTGRITSGDGGVVDFFLQTDEELGVGTVPEGRLIQSDDGRNGFLRGIAGYSIARPFDPGEGDEPPSADEETEDARIKTAVLDALCLKFAARLCESPPAG